MELEKKMESDNIKQIVPTGHGMARFLKEHGVEHVFGKYLQNQWKTLKNSFY